MRWVLKPIMRRVAAHKLDALYEEHRRLSAAIKRMEKSKAKVLDLRDLLAQTTAKCLRWEAWL